MIPKNDNKYFKFKKEKKLEFIINNYLYNKIKFSQLNLELESEPNQYIYITSLL